MAPWTGLRVAPADERGSILLSGMMLVFIITLTGLALFNLGMVDHRLAINDRDTERTFYAAEAGLQRALLDLSDGDGTNDFATVQATPRSLTGFANKAFSGGSYTVTASTTGLPSRQIRLTSTGCLPAGTCPGGTVQQTVQALAVQLNTLPGAVLGNINVNFSGGGLTDSYNSTNGAYNAATANSNGDVLGNGTITFKGTVKGYILSTTNTGSNPEVSVASASTVTGNVQSGGTVQNQGTVNGQIIQNTLSAPIKMPVVASCGPPYSSGSGLSGSYTYKASTGALTVSGGHTVTLANGSYCFSTVTVSGGSTLAVNGAVTISVTGQFNASGSSIVNSTQKPVNLQILSSYTGSSNGVVLSGGSGAYLTVYAPQTQLVISGSGDVFGAVAANDIQSTGGSKVHFDEALLGNSALNGGVPTYTMQSWKHCLNATCS